MGVNVLEMTCTRCGRQRYFPGHAANPDQRTSMESERCSECGNIGAAMAWATYEGELPFKLEGLPRN
ncbi:MAG TPA: hypothetical protein VGN07_16390 [Steroidobacteraceae bacterium]|jgi:transposase